MKRLLLRSLILFMTNWQGIGLCQQDVEGYVAKILDIKVGGKPIEGPTDQAKIKKAGKESIEDARIGLLLFPDDEFETSNAIASLKFNSTLGGGVVKINKNTKIQILGDVEQKTRNVFLIIGELWGKLKGHFKVKTKNGWAGTGGTKFLIRFSDKGESRTDIFVFEDFLYIGNGDSILIVTAPGAAYIVGENPPALDPDANIEEVKEKMKEWKDVVEPKFVFFPWLRRQFRYIVPLGKFGFHNLQRFNGGFGFSHLDNITYFMVTMRPEFVLGKIGIGIQTDLRIGTKDMIRREDWDKANDFVSIIRYLRYGQKHDQGFYARFGVLNRAMLGYGQQIYLYSNEISLDNRKRGFVFDYHSAHVGFESLYSNIIHPEVFGARVFVCPFYALPNPIIHRFAVGVSASTDQDEKITIVGADLGLPLITTSALVLTPYCDHAIIIYHGQGTALGIRGSTKIPNIINLDVQLERRFIRSKYLPGYFNAFYEVERNQKRNRLTSESRRSGWHGSLSTTVLGFIQVEGSYERLGKVPNCEWWLHLGTEIRAKGSIPVLARVSYDHRDIGGETTGTDELLTAEFGYKPMSGLLISMIYQRSFAPETRFEPRVQISSKF